MPSEIVYLLRDCYAAMVPSGAKMKLHKGTEVKITQQLGNSFTVDVFGNLARIEGRDADALGKQTEDPLAHLPPDASVEDQVWALLRTVYDPEIPVNIVDLGLVYQCNVRAIAGVPTKGDSASRDGGSQGGESRFSPLIPSIGFPDAQDMNQKAIDAQDFAVTIEMTLTAPGCGMGPVIAEDAKNKLLCIPRVKEAAVNIVFDPPWNHDMMSELAKLELGM